LPSARRRPDARSAWREGVVAPGPGATSLFITPGREFKVVDRLPQLPSPPLHPADLVSAFAGVELIREAYARAVREKYRFFSYGDCMLIL